MTHKKNRLAALLVPLTFGILASGCVTFTQLFSPNFAIGADGRLNMVLHNTSEHALNKEGVSVRVVMIGGVNYPYSMVQKAPSGNQEKNAVHTSIWPNAPDGWTSYVPGKYLIYPKRPAYTQPKPPPLPPKPDKPRPTPQEHPTLTWEEFEKVELAYAETVRDIEQRGRRLNISSRQERAAFIQRWPGRPDTASADAARTDKLWWYTTGYSPKNSNTENWMFALGTDIVVMARKEPNAFRKVRMIHDWVADIFAYDYDLLWWMDNVSGQNAEYTLGKILKLERGVCLEYAILFWFLMDAAGIDTYLVCDWSGPPDTAHAYNMVVINGTGYIIDTTWDSGNKFENGRITQWKLTYKKTYFMPGIAQSYQLRGWD
jgi:transglutaminase-like putative cysteine protease